MTGCMALQGTQFTDPSSMNVTWGADSGAVDAPFTEGSVVEAGLEQAVTMIMETSKASAEPCTLIPFLLS